MKNAYQSINCYQLICSLIQQKDGIRSLNQECVCGSSRRKRQESITAKTAASVPTVFSSAIKTHKYSSCGLCTSGKVCSLQLPQEHCHRHKLPRKSVGGRGLEPSSLIEVYTYEQYCEGVSYQLRFCLFASTVSLHPGLKVAKDPASDPDVNMRPRLRTRRVSSYADYSINTEGITLVHKSIQSKIESHCKLKGIKVSVCFSCFLIHGSLAICRPSGCTVASGVVGVVVVVGVCDRSQMRTSKCKFTCLIFGVSIGLDPAQKKFL